MNEVDPDIAAMEAGSDRLFHAIVDGIYKFDEGEMTRLDLVVLIKPLIAKHVEQTYDRGFMRGLEEADLDMDGAETEIEVELEEDDDEGDNSL
jgi:hypothetical protein